MVASMSYRKPGLLKEVVTVMAHITSAANHLHHVSQEPTACNLLLQKIAILPVVLCCYARPAQSRPDHKVIGHQSTTKAMK